LRAAAPEAGRPNASAMLTALGGRQNVTGVESFAGRLALRISDLKAVDERALLSLGVRGVAHPSAGSVQLLIPGAAEEWAQPLRRLLA
jgi:PTS system N-acetylglucosamine-specific IIC component